MLGRFYWALRVLLRVPVQSLFPAVNKSLNIMNMTEITQV